MKSRFAKGFDPNVQHQVGIMNSTTPKNLRKERPTRATEVLWRLEAVWKSEMGPSEIRATPKIELYPKDRQLPFKLSRPFSGAQFWERC